MRVNTGTAQFGSRLYRFLDTARREIWASYTNCPGHPFRYNETSISSESVIDQSFVSQASVCDVGQTLWPIKNTLHCTLENHKEFIYGFHAG